MEFQLHNVHLLCYGFPVRAPQTQPQKQSIYHVAVYRDNSKWLDVVLAITEELLLKECFEDIFLVNTAGFRESTDDGESQLGGHAPQEAYQMQVAIVVVRAQH